MAAVELAAAARGGGCPDCVGAVVADGECGCVGEGGGGEGDDEEEDG